MRKNANFANHKYALRRILLINILKLKQLVSNLYHFAFGREVHTNGMNADGTMSVAAGDPTLSVTPLKGLEMLPDRIPCENSMLDISEYKQSENPLIFTVEGSSMSPEDISNGDKLLCRKVDTKNSIIFVLHIKTSSYGKNYSCFESQGWGWQDDYHHQPCRCFAAEEKACTGYRHGRSGKSHRIVWSLY